MLLGPVYGLMPACVPPCRLQAVMGGKSAARVTRSTKQDENNPNNYPA